jgi:hypothetical protein
MRRAREIRINQTHQSSSAAIVRKRYKINCTFGLYFFRLAHFTDNIGCGLPQGKDTLA